jgi:hypothetical protein
MVDPSRYYPVIHEHDYVAFRAFPNLDLPNTYDEWRKLTEDIRRQRDLMGEKVILVEINPHEFAAYCRSSGMTMDSTSIGRFAMEKGGRNLK